MADSGPCSVSKLSTDISEDTVGPAKIPLGWAVILLLYLLTAFLLMVLRATGDEHGQIELLGYEMPIARAHELFFRYSVIGLGVVPAVLLLEAASVGWDASSLRSFVRPMSLSGRSDLVCFLLMHLRWMRFLQIALTFGMALISGNMVYRLMAGALGLDLSYDWMTPWARFPLFFMMYTFFDYVAHRVDHSGLFWPLHRFHHAAEEFNVFTADRGHPASTLTQNGIKVFPLVVLGVPAEAVVDVGILVAAINYLNHSRVDWDFGWFGRYVIQSPRHHRLHHAREGRVVNYSLVPLWDRLGGTWQDADRTLPALGTSEPYRHGAFILTDVLRDYREFLSGLMQAGARAVGAGAPVRNDGAAAADGAEAQGRVPAAEVKPAAVAEVLNDPEQQLFA